ncbi:MAG: hypothetical protein Q8P24_02535, partial [Desulfobacterales bacterium]|nr:hypothetical protein [Desulfobacterales bacterium]
MAEVDRAKKRVPDKVLTGVGIVLAVYHLIWVSTLFPRLGMYLQVQQHRAISLGLFLLLTFLTRPAIAGRRESGLPWYDMLLILASILPTGYYALFYELVQEHWIQVSPTPAEIVFAFLLVAAILEAGRRVVGWTLPVIVVFFVIHALFTEHFPGILFGRAPSLARLTGDIYLSLDGIFGYPIWVAGTVVITFILFSQLLMESGAG